MYVNIIITGKMQSNLNQQNVRSQTDQIGKTCKMSDVTYMFETQIWFKQRIICSSKFRHTESNDKLKRE